VRVEEEVHVASYTGPATIVSPCGEIEVTVDLRSRTDPDGCLTWGGHIDRCDRNELRRAMNRMSAYGLIIRLPDGREGNFIPSPEATWSPFSISVSLFMRGSGDVGSRVAVEGCEGLGHGPVPAAAYDAGG